VGSDGTRQIPFDIALELPDHTLLKTFKDFQERVLKGRVLSKVSRLVSMGRLKVGRKALVLRMGEPMSNRTRRKTEQVLPSRRRFSSNNHNRLWRFCWQLLVESLLTLADDGRRP
jgi:hypothetical protein